MMGNGIALMQSCNEILCCVRPPEFRSAPSMQNIITHDSGPTLCVRNTNDSDKLTSGLRAESARIGEQRRLSPIYGFRWCADLEQNCRRGRHRVVLLIRVVPPQRWTICSCRLRRVGAPLLLDQLPHACDKQRQLNFLWTFWNLVWCSLRFQTIVATLRLPISKGARSTTHLNLGYVERCGISSVVVVANNSPDECARLGRALRYGFLDGGIRVADGLGVDRRRSRSRSPYRRGTFAVGQRRRY